MFDLAKPSRDKSSHKICQQHESENMLLNFMRKNILVNNCLIGKIFLFHKLTEGRIATGKFLNRYHVKKWRKKLKEYLNLILNRYVQRKLFRRCQCHEENFERQTFARV